MLYPFPSLWTGPVFERHKPFPGIPYRAKVIGHIDKLKVKNLAPVSDDSDLSRSAHSHRHDLPAKARCRDCPQRRKRRGAHR